MVLPLGNPGQIKQIFMKEGDRVKKDEIILKLDDTIIKTQIAALTTQLDFARDLYQRQNKLWQQKIGSEVQVLNAKNTVVNLENQLQILNRSLDFTNVKAPIDGTIDILNVKKGEVFNGFTGRGEAQIRVTNSKDMKLSVLVPENYSTKVKINYPVKVEFPDNNRSFYQKIKSIAQYIDPSTRSFAIEIPIPQGNDLRPNQIGIVKILDFSMPKAIVIPVNIIQTDENGKYVYIAKTESDKKLAQKVYIELGEVYGEKAQIKKGLSLKDVLIIEGYQNISDGQELTNIQVD
ncbi:multidrug resistance protein MdtA-like [Rhinoderma darwinii]|uniref:multidrug resistance protein MdtA-like n=1 Tax=Rhinoderma darwinii TaxID=43563 RepID=UPI003F67CE07